MVARRMISILEKRSTCSQGVLDCAESIGSSNLKTQISLINLQLAVESYEEKYAVYKRVLLQLAGNHDVNAIATNGNLTSLGHLITDLCAQNCDQIKSHTLQDLIEAAQKVEKFLRFSKPKTQVVAQCVISSLPQTLQVRA